MRNILFGAALIASSLFSTAAVAQDGSVHFKGNPKGLKDSLIVFTPQSDGNYKRDTVLTTGGSFDFTLNVASPVGISAFTPGSLRHEENIGFRAVAVPGESAEISGDLASGYHFDGSNFYKQYNEVDRAIEAANKPYRDYVSTLDSRMAAGGDRETLMKEYKEKGMPLLQQAKESIMSFIKQHPDNEACATAVSEFNELDDMKAAAALLSPAVREGRMKDFYQRAINQAEEQAQKETQSAAKQAAGIMAPDFTLNDINGKPLSLSSLRGKYVILDFWGGWCIWCVKGFPEMKNYYAKYKGKFEILGIDCNETEVKWKEAVKKHDLPWLHVYNPKDSKVLSEYGIQGFPTKIIVGPDGKIVKTVVGEDPSFYTFLDETFGK